MSGLGRAVGISMMLHERLEHDAARDAQMPCETTPFGREIRLPERTARTAARADIAMMLRLIGKDRPMAGSGAHP